MSFSINLSYAFHRKITSLNTLINKLKTTFYLYKIGAINTFSIQIVHLKKQKTWENKINLPVEIGM